jgi:hypothetical protein
LKRAALAKFIAALFMMAEQHGFDIVEIAMKNTHNVNMKELLIGRDLDWARKKYTLF